MPGQQCAPISTKSRANSRGPDIPWKSPLRLWKAIWTRNSLMFRKCGVLPLPLLLVPVTFAASAQERRAPAIPLDVNHYAIDAQVNPHTQSIVATVKVDFTPLENLSSAAFELNNALNVSKVVDDTGRQIPASRNQQDFTIHLD